ncbi:MAG: MarR family transcriptional regulator [Chitinophagaceae bacterium]|nr:MarR family transcriptional regulator [Chitinophagaceae bacterium]
MMEPIQKPLERLIQQRVPFRSPKARVEVGLLYLASVMQSDMNRYFKPFGITPQQYNVLRILRGQHPKPSSINLIRERMLDKMCDASRIVERLIKNGMVVKKVNPRDKRIADIFITDNALQLLAEVDIQFYEKESVAYVLNEHDTTMLNDLIDKMLATRL